MNVVDKIASIQPFDWAVVGFIVLMFVLGYAQGIIRRLLGIATILFSFLLAANLREPLGGFLAQYWTQWPKEYSYMLAFGFLFAVLIVVFALITESFYKRAQVFPNAPALDELIGGLLGIVQALVLVGILIVVLDSAFKAPVAIGQDQIAFIKDLNGAVTGSATAAFFRADVLPYVVALAGPLLPADIHGLFPLPLIGRVVKREILAGPTLEAAGALLGARLVRDGPDGQRTGRIVEVEAYIGEADRASHARFGRTARNDAMYGEPGRAYLYLVYGMHVCLNVVTEPAGQPAAILVRAVELLTGLELARAARLDHRARARRRPADPVARAREVARIAALPAERVASGPGLVGAAFGLETEMTGLDLCDLRSALRLESAPAGEPRPAVRATPRIGIAYAGSPWTEVRWRLFLEGHPSVSGPVRAD